MQRIPRQGLGICRCCIVAEQGLDHWGWVLDALGCHICSAFCLAREWSTVETSSAEISSCPCFQYLFEGIAHCALQQFLVILATLHDVRVLECTLGKLRNRVGQLSAIKIGDDGHRDEQFVGLFLCSTCGLLSQEQSSSDPLGVSTQE